MPYLSLAQSEIIKRRLFRAREHLQCVAPAPAEPASLQRIAHSTYEFTRALKLPAVKHIEGQSAVVYREDAITNLTTAIDYNITLLPLDEPGVGDEAVTAADELLRAVQAIPIPVLP